MAAVDRRAYWREYHYRNAERVRLRRRARYLRDREHREHRLAYDRTYYAKHRRQVIARMRAYRRRMRAKAERMRVRAAHPIAPRGTSLYALRWL